MSFTGSSIGRYSRLWLIITGIILLGARGGLAICLGSIPVRRRRDAGDRRHPGRRRHPADRHRPRSSAGALQSTDQILPPASPGTAQITGVTQTGMYLNEQPAARAEPAGAAARPGAVRGRAQVVRAADAARRRPVGRAAGGARRSRWSHRSVVVDWQGLPAIGCQRGWACRMAAAVPMTGAAAGRDASGSASTRASARSRRRWPAAAPRRPPFANRSPGQLHGRAAARLPAPAASQAQAHDRQARGHAARSSATSACTRWR